MPHILSRLKSALASLFTCTGRTPDDGKPRTIDGRPLDDIRGGERFEYEGRTVITTEENGQVYVYTDICRKVPVEDIVKQLKTLK